uniref:L1 transposable element RRM domain-containing protein n=1 Tax=Equus caballus TaxID=9796 RepID=A0A9L0TKU5_HORSE
METIKKQSEILEMKDIIDEIKQTMDSLNTQTDITEEQIGIIKDRHTEMLQIDKERELRLKRNEESLQEISNSIRKCNIRIIRIQEGEEKNRAESLFKEITAENFLNLEKEMEIHMKEATRNPKYVNVKRPTARHIVVRSSKYVNIKRLTARYIVVKLAKVNDKQKILTAAR